MSSIVGFFANTSTRKTGRSVRVLIAGGRDNASWIRSSDTGQLDRCGRPPAPERPAGGVASAVPLLGRLCERDCQSQCLEAHEHDTHYDDTIRRYWLPRSVPAAGTSAVRN